MNFKISTKEKMHVISVQESVLTAVLAEEMAALCKSYLSKDIRNVILDLGGVESIQHPAALLMPDLQNTFLEANASLVFCNFNQDVRRTFQELEIDDLLNITPTESEAWDIVQMEEIERELLG